MKQRNWALVAVAALIAVALIATACGNGGDAANTPPTTADTQTTAHGAGPMESTTEATSTTAAPGSAVDVPPGTAVVAIGSTTYEFDLSSLGAGCTTYGDLERLTVAGWVNGDFDEAMLSADIYPSGHDQEGLFSVNYVNVQDPATGSSWMADVLEYPLEIPLGEIAEGASQIDSVTLDGGYAVGTATFIETNAVRAAYTAGEDLPASVGGTFEINCNA